MDPRADELIGRLRRNPDDDAAFRALGDHYRQLGDFASLANLLEGWAGRATDPQLAAKGFIQAGEIVSGQLGDPGRARSLFEQALARDPHAEGALDGMLAMVEGQDPAATLDLLRRRGSLQQHRGDHRGLADTEYRIGHLYEHDYARPDKAIAHYRKAFEADPALVPAIYAAREIYRKAGNHKAAATLFELEIKAEQSQERRVALLRELAHTRQNQLNDIAGAIDALSRAEREAGHDLGVLHELATVLLQRAEKRGKGQAAADDRHKAADLLARIADQVPPDHAIAYCESALDAWPGHEHAMGLLEHLARETSQEERLPARWVAYLQVASDGPGTNDRRKKLGLAYVDAGQTGDAIVCLEPLLELGDPEAANALVELYREQGRDQDALRAMSLAVESLPMGERLPRLEEIQRALQAQGDHDGAMARAREILSIDAGHEEALTYLEGRLRKDEDHLQLRDLAFGFAQVHGPPVESKIPRLEEAAALSEHELGDTEGAIRAWGTLWHLAPGHADAPRELARLLEAGQRWDELVQVLQQQNITTTDLDAKVEILWRLVTIHRDQRQDLHSTIATLHSIRELRVDDMEAAAALCDALLQTGDVNAALPLLEQRIDTATERDDRVRLLELLASTLETQAQDFDGAFHASARLLDEDPANFGALDRMERIDEQTGNQARLVETLAYRAEVLEGDERAEVLARIADIVDQRLGDLERAADYYQQALDAAPGNPTVLDALCEVYDRSKRYKDLVVMLRERAKVEEDPAARSELYRRIARTLGNRVGNLDAAAEAWERVLEAGDDEEALRALAERRRAAGDEPGLETLLERLAAVVEDPSEKRDLRVERAQILERLDRRSEAIEVVRGVADELAPQHLPTLQLLAQLCEADEDTSGLADALERQMGLLEDAGLRLPIARKLADLYDGPLDDRTKAIAALYAWVEADGTDLEPQKRLVDHLGAEKRYQELVAALDAVAHLETDPETSGEAVRRAATISAEKLENVDAAWNRLAPRIDIDPASDEQLSALAGAHERDEALAELYVARAKTLEGVDAQKKRWLDAATVYEERLQNTAHALEATLRAYALDLSDEEMLEVVERRAGLADAWDRLAQVYEKLIRDAEPEQKVTLLVRHARILEDANDFSGALDRLLRACSLAPGDDEILALAEAMAPRAGRAEEMLHVYEVRKAKADNHEDRMEALGRAVRLCDLVMNDREHAFRFIAQGVALSLKSEAVHETLEELVEELDIKRPDPSPTDARERLAKLYVLLGDESDGDPRASGELMRRAARLYEHELDQATKAFVVLRTASSRAPVAEILDPLEALAERQGLQAQLDPHYAELVDEAIDQKSASLLLERRGRLLEEGLEKPSAAAEVYAKLTTIARGDDATDAAADKWLRCLRAAKRWQDLLSALQRESLRARKRPERRGALLREEATLWEEQLGNAWEAIDVWKKIRKLDPEDPEPNEAIARLEESSKGHEEPSTSELLALDEAPVEDAEAPELAPEQAGALASAEAELDALLADDEGTIEAVEDAALLDAVEAVDEGAELGVPMDEADPFGDDEQSEGDPFEDVVEPETGEVAAPPPLFAASDADADLDELIEASPEDEAIEAAPEADATGELDVSDLESADDADVMSVEEDWVEEGWVGDAADTSRGPAVEDVLAEQVLADEPGDEILTDQAPAVKPLLDASTQELDDLEALVEEVEPAPLLDASTQELDDLEDLVEDIDAAEELDLDELEVEEIQAAPSMPPPPPGKTSMPPPPPGSLPPPPPPPTDD